MSHLIKQQVWRRTQQPQSIWVRVPLHMSKHSSYVCIYVVFSMRVYLYSKSVYPKDRGHIESMKWKSTKTNHQSSQSDRWFAQKQLRSVIEQPQEVSQTKQCLTPVSRNHVWNFIHTPFYNSVTEVTINLQFTVTFCTSIGYSTFKQKPFISSNMV